jgi:hypothetical protein
VKKSPNWGLRALVALVVLVLFVGTAEIALRLIIPDIITGQVRQSLQLSDDHPVTTVLGGSVALNAVTGRIGDVTISVDDAPVTNGIIADLRAHADSLPFDLKSGDVVGGTARVTIPADRLDPVVTLLTRGVAQTGQIEGGELVVGRSLNIFGQSLPLEVRLGLTIGDGDVLLQPESVAVVGLGLTADQISAATGTLLDPILRPEPLCVRSALPVGITLTDITFSSTGSVSVDLSLSPGILSDPSQQQLGSCG